MYLGTIASDQQVKKISKKILMLHSQHGWVGCLGSLDVGAINDINILVQLPLCVELMQGKAPKVTFLVNNAHEMGITLQMACILSGRC